MATDHNFIVKNGLEVGGVLIVNSSGQLEVTTVVNDLHLQDNVKAKFGLGSDLKIYHSGNHSYVQADGTGSLYLENLTSNQDVYIRANDDGSMKTFIHVDANVGVVKFPNGTRHADSQKANFGSSNDFQIWHDGTDNNIRSTGGDIYISQDVDDGDILIESDNGSGGSATYAMADGSEGSFKLYHYGSKKLETVTGGVDITGTLNTSGAIVASGDGHTFYSGGGSSTASFGRNLNEALHINVTDGNITLTADQDSDSNGTHEFILDRTFDGSGANNFVIKKGGASQLLIDTNGHVRFFGEIHAKDSNSTTDPSITFNGHTTTGMSVTNSGSQDELHFITGGTRRMHLNDAGVTSFANVYTGATGTFRNYSGTWQGTTGTSGNGFKFVNTADSVTPLNVTSSGQLTLTNQPTSTYMTHLSNGQLRNESSNGNIEIGPANTSHCHIETDRSNFYFNKELRVDSGIIGSYNEDLVLRRASSAANQIVILENKIRGSNATTQGNSAMILGGIIGQAALEEGTSDHFYLPGISTNRLAGTNRRFSVTATLDGSSISIGDEAFTAGASNFQVGSLTSSSVVVITVSNFGGLSYGSHAGIVFGNTTWRAKDVKIETSTDGTNYTTRTDQTNQPNTTVYKYFSSGGTATTHIRYTLTNFNTTSTRINHIFAYNYNTQDQHFTQAYKNESIYSDWTWQDTRQLKFGNGGDLGIYHDGSNSVLNNITGNLQIYNNADDGDIQFISDNGSGGTAEYFRLDGGDVVVKISKTMLHFDNVKASFGNSEDMRIKHDGSNGSIDNYTGDLLFRNNVDDKDIILQSDDGSGGLADYIRLDGSDTSVRVSQHLKLPDDKALYFGDGQDLNIWHSGTNSLIDHIGTGSLFLRNTTNDTDVYIQTDDGSGGLANYFVADGSSGAVRLYYYGAEKLATKSDGVDIQGELQADSLDIDGAGDISGNLTIGGNLTVNGTTVTNSATNTTIEDALIELGSGNTGTNSNDLGLILERGTSGNNVFIGFDESDDQIAFALTTATGSSTGSLAFSSFLPIKTGTLDTTGGVTHNLTGAQEVMIKMNNDTGNRNALTLNHEYDRDIGIHYHTSGGDYEVWMDSAGDDSLIFSPGTAGAPALELYQNKKAQFYGTSQFNGMAQFESTVQFDVAGTNVEFLSDTTTREVLSFKQSGTTKWLLKLDNVADLNLIPSSASSNFQINSADFVDGSRNLTVSSLTASGTSTLAGPVLVNGAHDNGGKADFAVEVGGSYAQLSLYGDQVQAGSTDMNWNAKFFTDAAGGNIAVWDNNLTFFTQGSNTGSASARDIIFKPQTSGTAVATERMRIKGDGNVGIGTSNPGSKLTVEGDIRQTTGDLLYSGGGNWDIKHLTNDQNIVFSATTGSTTSEKMRIRYDGYVGIGTSSPADKLEVQGNTRAERFIVDGGGAMLRKQVDSWQSGAQTHDILYNGWTNSTGDYTYVKAAGNGTTGHGIIQVGDLGTWIGQTNLEQGALADSNTTPIDSVFAFFRGDKAYIKGDLGVGTNAPGSKLHIASGAAAADDLTLLTLENGNSTGDISTPNTFIDFKFTDSNTNVTPQARIGAHAGDGGDADSQTKEGKGYLTFHTSDTTATSGTVAPPERLRITHDGKVGIGTTSPSKGLQLESNSDEAKRSIRLTYDSSYYFDLKQKGAGGIQYNAQNATSGGHRFDIDGSEKFRVAYNGNTGIGETSPVHKVEAKGTDAALVVHNDGNSRGGIVALASQLVGFTSTSVNDDLVFGHAGNPITSSAFNEKMRIDNGTGNVSIGTSGSGARKLDILDAGDTNGEIIQIKGGSNYGAVITYHRGSSYSWEAGVGGGSSQDANIPASYWGVGERAASGRPARLLIAHTSGNVGIGATPQTSGSTRLRIGGTGDPHIRIEDFDGTDQYVNLGHNGGDTTYVSRNNTSHGTHSFYSYNGTSTTLRFKLNANGTASFNNAFTLPSSDGSANQVLITNGSGTVTWGDVVASNADTVDNLHATSFLRSDANDDFSGTLNYTPDTGTILSVDGQAILQRMTANGAITIGHDDAVIIAGGDTSGVLNTNITNSTETVFLGAEGGVIMYAFPNNDITWTNRRTFSFDGTNGINLNGNFTVDNNGNLSATTKSFDIEHPTKEGMRLHHGVLEGPEHAVYYRGKSNSYIIELPDYWEGLVHEDTITVQLTPIGGQNDMWVENIEDNKVYINCEREMKQYFYYIMAERKDIERFEVEYEV